MYSKGKENYNPSIIISIKNYRTATKRTDRRKSSCSRIEVDRLEQLLPATVCIRDTNDLIHGFRSQDMSSFN
jgi:hypothetical protein